MRSLAFTQSTLFSRPHMPVLSSIRFRVFCSSPLSSSNSEPPSRPVLLYLLTGTLSLLYGPIFHRSDPPPPPRPRQATRRQSGLPASSSPRARASEFNYSSPHYMRKGQKLHWYNYFLPREPSCPFIDDLIQRSFARLPHISWILTRRQRRFVSHSPAVLRSILRGVSQNDTSES